MASDAIEIVAKVARKQPDLPRFAVVPAEAVAPWGLTGTTTIELSINGVAVDRRTMRKWDDERWFLSITEKDCKAAGIDTGTKVKLRMARASEELTAELAALLAGNGRAAAAWKSMTPNQQRMLRDEVAALKRSDARQRRAEKWLLSSP